MNEIPFDELMQGSVQLYRWFLSLTEAGFTEDQAIKFMSTAIMTPKEGT